MGNYLAANHNEVVPPEQAWFRRGALGVARNHNEIGGSYIPKRTYKSPFIKKVSLILLIQLVLTVASVCIFRYSHLREDVANDEGVFTTSSGVFCLLLIIGLLVCSDARRRAPMNFMFLGLILIGGIMYTAFSTNIILSQKLIFWSTLLSSTLICLGCTTLALHMKHDLTKFGKHLILTFILLLMFFMIAALIASREAIIVKVVFSILSAFLFSAFLMFNTQLLLGGNHKFVYAPDEHVMAILYLYGCVVIITGNINLIFLL